MAKRKPAKKAVAKSHKRPRKEEPDDPGIVMELVLDTSGGPLDNFPDDDEDDEDEDVMGDGD